MKNIVAALGILVCVSGIMLSLWGVSGLTPETVWNRRGQEAIALFIASFTTLVLVLLAARKHGVA